MIAALDRLERELDNAGGEYLAGDAFSVADLTAAALFYPLVNPPEGPSILPDPTPEGSRSSAPRSSGARAIAGSKRCTASTASRRRRSRCEAERSEAEPRRR